MHRKLVEVTSEFTGDHEAPRPDAIERHHVRIDRLLGEFCAAVRKRSDLDTVLHILDEIIDRVRGHFAAEETLLRIAEEPGYRFQKATHGLIVDELKLLRRRLGASGQVPSEVCIDALDLLLMLHIRDEPPRLVVKGQRPQELRAALA